MNKLQVIENDVLGSSHFTFKISSLYGMKSCNLCAFIISEHRYIELFLNSTPNPRGGADGSGGGYAGDMSGGFPGSAMGGGGGNFGSNAGGGYGSNSGGGMGMSGGSMGGGGGYNNNNFGSGPGQQFSNSSGGGGYGMGGGNMGGGGGGYGGPGKSSLWWKCLMGSNSCP